MAAGFRPCLRCRPETSPGAPAWNGTSAVVTRALRLIEQGALDDCSLPALCDRLGVGERQLRRLFDQHLGASPSVVDGSRRLMLAKKLLTETALPVGEIAHAVGYRSPRRFREAVRNAYGRSPSSMRRSATDANSIELRLGFRPPYDREAMMKFLAARAIPGVEAVVDGRYRRTVRVGESVGRLEARIGGSELVAQFSGLKARDLPAAIARVRALFDLSADPAAIGRGLSGDPVLAALNAGRPGLRVPGAWDGFELCVRTVLGQQVTVAGASTLTGRLVKRFGESLDGDGPGRLFPRPEALTDAPFEEIGLPRRRAETLRSLARANVDLTAPSAPVELLAIAGIGAWTVQYVAMRAMGDPDAFPAGDLGLRRSWSRLTGEEVSREELEAASRQWRPWRAYAAMHLWLAEGDHVD